MDDTQFLRTYIENGSEQAFERVVERHIQLVHSAALRQCDGDTRRAEEVTQMVFTDLARKAERLKNHPLLIGWLHRSTRLASNNLRRSEQRRRQLEQAFACDNALSSTAEPPVDWEQIRPWIDEALDKLNQSEREAVLLRFFENLSFDEIGRLLGIADNTARMRVSRALTKLHSSLSRKGLRWVLRLAPIAWEPSPRGSPPQLPALRSPKQAQRLEQLWRADYFSCQNSRLDC